MASQDKRTNPLPMQAVPPLPVDWFSKITRLKLNEESGDGHLVALTKCLARWARVMRDDIVPRYPEERVVLGKSDQARFMDDFDLFMGYPNVSANMLCLSRFHLALSEMNKANAWWDEQSRKQAHSLLLKWQSKFGDLEQLMEDIWDEGGPMANVAKIKDSHAETISNSIGSEKHAWSIIRPPGNMASRTGDLGFPVGRWWIKPAAAYRDGIIDKLSGITANEQEAFSLVLENHEEVSSSTPTTLVYRPDPSRPMRVKLMKNILTHNSVRVLRSYKLDSQWRPEAGLRYDGQYAVKQYSVTSQSTSAQLTPIYTFTLERLKDQAPLDQALKHPTSEEMDDWHTYQKQKNLHLVKRSEIDMTKPGQVILPSS